MPDPQTRERTIVGEPSGGKWWTPGGGGVGGGFGRGFSSGRSRLGVARFPGADPLPVPDDLKNLTQFKDGYYDPEMMMKKFGNRGGYPTVIQGQQIPGRQLYDAEGRPTGTADPTYGPSVVGWNPNTRERLGAMSSAAGWAMNPMQRQTGVSQGADLRSPDALRRLLEARMGGGGF